jgi:hypothetical protein
MLGVESAEVREDVGRSAEGGVFEAKEVVLIN